MIDLKHHASHNKGFTKLFKEIQSYFVKNNWEGAKSNIVHKMFEKAMS